MYRYVKNSTLTLLSPISRHASHVVFTFSFPSFCSQGVIAEPIIDVLDVSDLIGTTLAEYAEACAEAKEEVDGTEVELTCEAIDPNQVKLLAVSATDGLMDFVDVEDIASVYASSFYVENNPHPHTATEFLILTSAQRWDETYDGQYRDDIAVASFKIYSDDSILAASAATAEN